MQAGFAGILRFFRGKAPAVEANFPGIGGDNERSVNVFEAWGAGGANHSRVFLPLDPLFSAGRPGLKVKRPQTFLAREGLRRAFSEKPLLDYWRPSRDKPDLALMLGLRFTRGPPAASAARSGGGSFRSSPARSARSAFAVQLRPRFRHAPGERDLPPLADTRGVRHSASRPQTGKRLEGNAERPRRLLGVWLSFGLWPCHYRKPVSASRGT